MTIPRGRMLPSGLLKVAMLLFSHEQTAQRNRAADHNVDAINHKRLASVEGNKERMFSSYTIS